MEKIKYLCFFVLCSSLMILTTTFNDAIYPKGDQALNAYATMIEEYEKIAGNSGIDENAIRNIVSEDEFNHEFPVKEVENRMHLLLNDTKNFTYLFEEEQIQEISEQFALIYDQQMTTAKNEAYSRSMRTIRIWTILLSLISSTIIFAIKKWNKAKV